MNLLGSLGLRSDRALGWHAGDLTGAVHGTAEFVAHMVATVIGNDNSNSTVVIKL